MRRNNEIRARWAERALATFAACTGGSCAYPEDLTDVIVDLIGDLHHLCDREKIDFHLAVRQAQEHHRAEQEDEEDPWDIDDDPVASPALDPPVREALNEFARALTARGIGEGPMSSAREEAEKRLSIEMEAREARAYAAGGERAAGGAVGHQRGLGLSRLREGGPMTLTPTLKNAIGDLENTCHRLAEERARLVPGRQAEAQAEEIRGWEQQRARHHEALVKAIKEFAAAQWQDGARYGVSR